MTHPIWPGGARRKSGGYTVVSQEEDSRVLQVDVLRILDCARRDSFSASLGCQRPLPFSQDLHFAFFPSSTYRNRARCIRASLSSPTHFHGRLDLDSRTFCDLMLSSLRRARVHTLTSYSRHEQSLYAFPAAHRGDMARSSVAR
jgi:hypothetical protein